MIEIINRVLEKEHTPSDEFFVFFLVFMIPIVLASVIYIIIELIRKTK